MSYASSWCWANAVTSRVLLRGGEISSTPNGLLS
jgi:hypothetical protein